ncbi:uncharacterized protein LOC127810877 [Diospyros lotus]|uniref:uncharacterized protein LOC127810877 n=1 Tax=Diospyros lotus TaxID=55363 RepID=UPI00224F4109|nr:uncharacterized protein LOC127810877 [Diospyros lotus]XP_052206417.1 uncharacterized protein LOC127810877 [Diospyros lotus]
MMGDNMVPTLKAIKGGGGSVKVGTTGTIGTLMSRELESAAKSTAQPPVSSRNESHTDSISVSSDAITFKRLKPRTVLDEASSSSSCSRTAINKKNPETARKTKHQNRKTQQIPMLYSDNISLDGTPSREKPDKRGSYIVEVVDLKCGNTERTWANPITNRFKELGFSKLMRVSSKSETSPHQLSGSCNCIL